MLGLNPGKAERQIHDEYMTRWVYETNDTADEILSCENYLAYLNHSPAKIDAGDEIIILSKAVTGEFNKITLTVGYNPEEDSYFPISAHIPAGSEVSASDISSLSAISPC